MSKFFTYMGLLSIYDFSEILLCQKNFEFQDALEWILDKCKILFSIHMQAFPS